MLAPRPRTSQDSLSIQAGKKWIFQSSEKTKHTSEDIDLLHLISDDRHDKNQILQSLWANDALYFKRLYYTTLFNFFSTCQKYFYNLEWRLLHTSSVKHFLKLLSALIITTRYTNEITEIHTVLEIQIIIHLIRRLAIILTSKREKKHSSSQFEGLMRLRPFDRTKFFKMTKMRRPEKIYQSTAK